MRMAYCTLCKQTKDTKHNWVIYENGADGIVKKYKVCDDCAIHLLKEISSSILGLREGEELPLPLQLTRIGAIDGIQLLSSGDIEITIKIDYSQAKRIIEKKLEEKVLEELRE